MAPLAVEDGYKRADCRLHSRMAESSSTQTKKCRSSDFSYFSSAAPHTASAATPSPPSPCLAQRLEITQPIITSSVLPSSRISAFSYSQYNQHVHSLHQVQHLRQLQQQHGIYTHQLLHPSEELRQFALHIPAPPQLTMPAKLLARQDTTSSSSSSSSSPSSLSPSGPAGGYPSPSPSAASRSPSFNSTPQGPDMVCTTDTHSYLLIVTGLPSSITSDMVTISANKGDRLRVNAQAWGGENSSNFDWQVSFPPRDVDLSRVQARFDRVYLTIRVPRYHKPHR